MAVYIMLIRLTPEGRLLAADDPQRLLRAEHEIGMIGIEMLGMYGVLGQYDFVGLVEAPDNEAAAEFSLQLGLAAGVQVETLPAIPIGKLEGRRSTESLTESGGLDVPQGDGTSLPR
jgi:uncharacterized protein with GYD domain